MTPVSTPIVFIGSGEASLLERKTLAYSIRKHTRGPVDIRVFNGTHNAVERDGHAPVPAPLPLHIKYHNVTEFSLYRYLIPQLCEHRGRAIWLDSDTVCLRDIRELFDLEMGGAALMCKRAYDGLWGPSVMLLDCARARFDLETIFAEIDRGLYDYRAFTRFSPDYLAHHPTEIGVLPEQWNAFDYYDEATRLIHYTALHTQPWKYPGHPHGDLWFRYFEEARAHGAITDDEIKLTIARSYCRRDIRDGIGVRDATPPRGAHQRLLRPLAALYRKLRARAP